MWNFGSTFSSCRISNGHEAMKGIFFFFCFCAVCVRKESNPLSLVEDDLWWKVQVASICLLFSHLFGFSIRASKDPIPISNLILFFLLFFFLLFFSCAFLVNFTTFLYSLTGIMWILPLFLVLLFRSKAIFKCCFLYKKWKTKFKCLSMIKYEVNYKLRIQILQLTILTHT